MLVSLIFAVGSLASSPRYEQATAVLFARYESPASVEAAKRLIRGANPGYRVEMVERLDRLSTQDADLVVVLSGRSREGNRLPNELFDVEALRGKKVVAIGYPAATALEKMGLETKGGNCAHGCEGPPRFEPTRALPAIARIEAGTVFDPPAPDSQNLHGDFYFGLHLASFKKDAGLRRTYAWGNVGDEGEYALIASDSDPERDMSGMLVCVEGRVDLWAAPFRRLVRSCVEAYAKADPSPRP